MDNQVKIRLYADSLGLPRIGHVSINQRYISLLTSYFVKAGKTPFSLDRSFKGVTITELYEQWRIDNAYFGPEGDILILQTGIVDCAPRPLSKNTRAIVGKLPPFFRNKIISFLHKYRKKLFKTGIKFVFTSPEIFKKTYTNLIQQANNFNKVFLITIMNTTNETEIHSPGITKNINKYNEIIELISNQFSNCQIIDINKEQTDTPVLLEDGHHITQEAHHLIFNQIIKHLDSKQK